VNIKKVTFRKAIVNAAEAMAKALCMNICMALNQRWLLGCISERMDKQEHYSILRLNAMVMAKLLVLKVDIDALGFSDGQLATLIPPQLPTPPDYENLFKSEDDYYSYQAKQAEQFYRDFNDLVNMLQGFIEVISPLEGETPSPDLAEFIQYLVDDNYVFRMFRDTIPFLLELAWRSGVLQRPKEPIDVPAIDPYYATYTASAKAVQPTQIQKADTLFINPTLMAKVKGPECLIKVTDTTLGIVTGIVLEPSTKSTPDLQGQWVKSEVIEQSCYEYMEKFGVLGYMHTQFNKKQGTQNPDFRLLENYILQADTTIGDYLAKKGTWIQTWKILNVKLKEAVNKGELTGFSVGGYAFITDGTKKTAA
jgi:hypothetical protein